MEFIQNGTYAFKFEVYTVGADQEYEMRYNTKLKEIFDHSEPVLRSFILSTTATLTTVVFTAEQLLQIVQNQAVLAMRTQFFDKYGIIVNTKRYEIVNLTMGQPSTACSNAMGYHFTKTGHPDIEVENDELELQIVQDARDDINLVLKTQEFISGCGQLTVNSIVSASITHKNHTNSTVPNSECYNAYWITCNGTTFPQTCSSYYTDYECSEIKDSKNQIFVRCHPEYTTSYCYILEKNHTATGLPVYPVFIDTHEHYGQYKQADSLISTDFQGLFTKTNNTDIDIKDIITLRFVIKATDPATNLIVYYMMEQDIKTSLIIKHPADYGGCLSYEVNKYHQRGCYIDYKQGVFKPTLTLRPDTPPITGVVDIKAIFYTEADDGTLVNQLEVAGDGSETVTAQKLFELNTVLEWQIGFEVTVDGTPLYSLLVSDRMVRIMPPPADDIADPPVPCEATLELKDERDKLYNLPQTFYNVYDVEEQLNETWTLGYNYNADTCGYRLTKLGLMTDQDWQGPCTDDNQCHNSFNLTDCDRVEYQDFQCDCNNPQACTPSYLPQGYTAECEEIYDIWHWKNGVRCDITDPDTKQTFCAVTSCNATYSLYLDRYYNPSYTERLEIELDEFLETTVEQPYIQAQFQLAEFAAKKWNNYQIRQKTVYVHASWFNPTTKEIQVTREELQLEAYAYSWQLNCDTFDSSRNGMIANDYFTDTFTKIVQFADWQEHITVAVPLKDTTNYRVSALVGRLEQWGCDHVYEYPEYSNLTSFGAQLQPSITDEELSFPDIVRLESSHHNFTIILTLLKLDGSVYEQYIVPSYLAAGAKDSASVQDTTACFAVGASLEKMAAYEGTPISFTIDEADFSNFNGTGFRVNVTSDLAGSDSNPACDTSEAIWCELTAFKDIDTYHLMKNEDLGFCNTALRVELSDTCTLANNQYSCNGEVSYTDCAAKQAKDGTQIQMCQRANPETGFKESVVLLPTALMDTTGDICEREVEEALFQGDLQAIWNKDWRYIREESSNRWGYRYRYYQNSKNETGCIKYFSGEEFQHKWAKERFSQTKVETSYAHFLVEENDEVEWIRKQIEFTFIQNATSPPLVELNSLINSTYIPRGLAFQNANLNANLWLNTDSHDIGEGPYDLNVQLKLDGDLIGHAKDLGGSTFTGTLFDYPTLYDAADPVLLGVRYVNASEPQCQNVTYCVPNPIYNDTTSSSFGATNHTNSSTGLNVTCSSYTLCNDTALTYLNSTDNLKYSFKALDIDDYARFAQDSDSIIFFPPKPADAVTPGPTDCMVNKFILKLNDTVLSPGGSGHYTVSQNATNVVLEFSSTNQDCTEMDTLIEQRLLTFEDATLICQIENKCYIDGADHFCQHKPDNYCYNDKCWIYYDNEYTSWDYKNITTSDGITYRRVVIEKDGIRSCFIPDYYFPYDSSSLDTYRAEHEVTTGRGYGTYDNQEEELSFTVNVQRFRWDDVYWIRLYHHAIYREDNTFKYTLTPVVIGIDDGSLIHNSFYSDRIQHGVALTYPDTELTPSAVNRGCVFKQIRLVVVNTTYNQWDDPTTTITEIMPPVDIEDTVKALDNSTALYQGTEIMVATLKKLGTLRFDYYSSLHYEVTTQCGSELNSTLLNNYLMFSPPFADNKDTCSSSFSIISPDGSTAITPQIVNNTKVYTFINPHVDTSTYTLRLDDSSCATSKLQALAVSENSVLDNICFNSYYCPSFPEPGCSQVYMQCQGYNNVCYYNRQSIQCQYITKYGVGYWRCPYGNGCIVDNIYRYDYQQELLKFPEEGSSQVDVEFTPSQNNPFFFGYEYYQPNSTYYAKVFSAKNDLSEYYFETIAFQFKSEFKSVNLTVTSAPLLTNYYYYTAYGQDSELVAQLEGYPDNGSWLIRFGNIGQNKFLSDFTGVKDNTNGEPIQYTFSLSAAEILQSIGYKRAPIELGLTYQRVQNPLPAEAYIDQYKQWFMAPPQPSDNTLDCLTITNTIELDGIEVDPNADQEYVFDKLDEVVIESKLDHSACTQQVSISQLLFKNHTNLMHECIEDGFCNNTIGADYYTLLKTDTPINYFFEQQASQVIEDNVVETTFQLSKLKYIVGNDKVTLYQHILAIDETNTLPVYKQFALKFDLTQTGSTDPDKTCDAQFCKLPVLPVVFEHDYNLLDSCDESSTQPGEKRKSFIREFNDTVTVRLVPDMQQCQIDSRQFLKMNTTTKKLEFNYTALAAEIGNSTVYNRALSNWYISNQYCYSETCRFYFSWNEGQYEHTFDAKTLAQNFTEWHDYLRKMKICARFSDCHQETCTYFELPPHYAPIPQVAPFQAALKVNDQTLIKKNGAYEITEDDDLVIELPSQCKLLHHQTRLYANTEIECSRFGICRNGDETSIKLDKDCYKRALKCTNGGDCQDHDFNTFSGCEQLTIGTNQHWKCIKTYANNTQTCVYSTQKQRPQESTEWSKCYDSNTWNAEGCDCVTCKEKMQQQQACIHILSVPSCPAPNAPSNCNSYYAYLSEIYEEDIEVENDFLPKDQLNNMLTFSTWEYENQIHISALKYSKYYKYYYSRNYRYIVNPPDYTLPPDGISIYATYICESRRRSDQIDQYMEKIQFKKKTLTPEQQVEAENYQLFKGFESEVKLMDPIYISPVILGPESNKISNSTVALEDGEPERLVVPFYRGVFDKFSFFGWSARLDKYQIKTTLDHTVLGNLKQITSAIYLSLGLTDQNLPNCELSYELTQDDDQIRTIGGKRIVRSGFSIQSEFSYSCAQVEEVFATTYKDLANGCQAKTKATCIPLPPNVCKYTNLHCFYNSTGHLNCYDGLNKHFSNCTETIDQNNKVYSKCDYSIGQPLGVPQFDCVINIPDSSTHSLTAILDRTDCDPWADTCPVSENCMQYYSNFTSLVDYPECVPSTSYTKYYQELQASARLSFPYDSVNDELNLRLEESEGEKDDDQFQHEVKPFIFEPNQGETKNIFYHIISSSSSGHLHYQILPFEFFFSPSATYEIQSPYLELVNHDSWTISLEYGTTLTLELEIKGLSTQADPADYRFKQIMLGEQDNTQHSSESVLIYSPEEIFEFLEDHHEQEELCFKVINRSNSNEFPQQCVTLNINFPDQDYDQTITCQEDPTLTITYDGTQAKVDSPGGKPYLSTLRLNKLVFDLSPCNGFLPDSHEVKLLALTQGDDMNEAKCKSNGLCAKENIDCDLKIMSCEPVSGGFNCTGLWGFQMEGGALVTDQNGKQTVRVDHNGDCYLQNKVSKHPKDLTSSPLKTCYDSTASSCYNNVPTSCMRIFAAQTSDPESSTATTSSSQCEQLRRAIIQYQELKDREYEKRGFNQRDQFVFTRSESYYLNMWLEAAHFHASSETELEIEIAPYDDLPVTSQDRSLYAHFLILVTEDDGTSTFGYYKFNLQAFVFARKESYYGDIQFGSSVGYFIDWNQALQIQVDDSNWDPTVSKSVYALFQDGHYCTEAFPNLETELTRDGVNMTATLTPLQILKCAGMSKQGGFFRYEPVVTEPSKPDKPIQELWKMYHRLRGPLTPDDTCTYSFSAKFDGQTTIDPENDKFPISYGDTLIHSSIEFTINKSAGCTLTPLYWMPRLYSDLALDRLNYDYVAKDEYCYPVPLLCSSASSCRTLGGRQIFTNCIQKADGSGFEHTLCRNDDICYLKDTSISDATMSQIAGCIATNTWNKDSCFSALPYCYNFELRAQDFFGPELITTYEFTFQEIIDEFSLIELTLEIDFDEANANTQHLSGQTLVNTLQDQYGIHLDWNIKEAVKRRWSFYKMCSKLYDPDLDGVFSGKNGRRFWNAIDNTPDVGISWDLANTIENYIESTITEDKFQLSMDWLERVYEEGNSGDLGLFMHMVAEKQGSTQPNYDRAEITLNLKSAELVVDIESDVDSGDTISNFHQFYIEAQCKDPLQSGQAEYSIEWSCSPSDQVCSVIRDQNTDQYTPKWDFTYFSYEDLAQIPNGSFTVTATCTKRVNNEVLSFKEDQFTFVMSAITEDQHCGVSLTDNEISTNDQQTYPLIVSFEEDDETCGTNTSFEVKLKTTAGLISCTNQWCSSVTHIPPGLTDSHLLVIPRPVVPVDQNNELSLCYTYTVSSESKTKCYPVTVKITQTLDVKFSKVCGVIAAENGFTTELTSSKDNWSLEKWVLQYPFTILDPSKTLSLTSDWLRSYRSEIEEDQDYSFEATIISTSTGEQRQLTCLATFTFSDLPQIYVSLSVDNLDSASYQDISAQILAKDGDNTQVANLQYSWLIQVENNGVFQDLTIPTGTSSSIFTLAKEFESGKKYKYSATIIHPEATPTPVSEIFTMSSKSEGKINLTPKKNLTNKVKVKITATKFENDIKLMKVKCYNSKKDKTKNLKTVANTNIIRKVKIPSSDRWRCWVDIIDKKGWEYKKDIVVNATQAATAASPEAQISDIGVFDAIINSDYLLEIFDEAEFNAQIKTQVNNMKGTFSAKAKINGSFNPNAASETLAEMSEIVHFYEDSPDDAGQVIPLNDLEEIMDYVSTNQDASSLVQFGVQATFGMLVLSEIEDLSSSEASKLYSSMRSSCTEGCNVNINNGVFKNERLTLDALQDEGDTKVNTTPSSQSGLETVECNIPNQLFKRAALRAGSSKVSINTMQRKLSTKTKNIIIGSDESVVLLNGSVQIELRTESDGLIGYDGSASVDFKWDVSSIRNLLTTTTVIHTAVCMRYDTSSSSWTTDGVTTVDDGVSVTCQTTESGSVTVKIVTTSTTTTTPEETGGSSGSNLGIIIGIAVGLTVLVLVIVLVIVLVKKNKKKRMAKRHSRTIGGSQKQFVVYDENEAIKQKQQAVVPETPAKQGMSVVAKDSDFSNDLNSSTTSVPTLQKFFPSTAQLPPSSFQPPTAPPQQSSPWNNIDNIPSIPPPQVDLGGDQLFSSPQPLMGSKYPDGKSDEVTQFQTIYPKEDEQVVIVEDVKTNE